MYAAIPCAIWPWLHQCRSGEPGMCSCRQPARHHNCARAGIHRSVLLLLEGKLVCGTLVSSLAWFFFVFVTVVGTEFQKPNKAAGGVTAFRRGGAPKQVQEAMDKGETTRGVECKYKRRCGAVSFFRDYQRRAGRQGCRKRVHFHMEKRQLQRAL